VGAASPSGAVDVWTLPAGLALTALGATVFRRRPARGSWIAFGPGVVLTQMPSLLVAVTSDDGFRDGVRGPALVALATLSVVVGVRLRLAAPFVLGLGVLLGYGLHVLGPTLLGLWRDAPPWLAVGLAGAVLLYVGATAERRLRDVAEARAKLAAMR
jgi:fatty acid desaturase